MNGSTRLRRVRVRPPSSTKQQFNSLRALVTYSTVTALCLQQIPLALTFSFTTTALNNNSNNSNNILLSSRGGHPSASSDKTITSASESERTSASIRFPFPYQLPIQSHSILRMRGGGQRARARSFLSMVSTSTERDIPTAANSNSNNSDNDDDSNDPKLVALRSKMKELGLDAFIIPSDDPHLSEYVPTAYMRRKYLTSFGGSAGTAVVTHSEALLWTDSRYFNEASMDIDANHWTLMKQGLPKVPSIPKYIADMAAKHYTDAIANANQLSNKHKNKTSFVVGLDPFVHPASFENDLNDAFDDAAESIQNCEELNTDTIDIGTLKTMENGYNPIDDIWGQDRPDIPTSPFKVHPLQYAGETIQSKVDKIRQLMTEKKATMVVFSALDDVAYLMNLRAKGDIDTCPVGISYAAVTMDAIFLFCDEVKVQTEDVRQHLADANVQVKPYNDIVAHIQSHLDDNAIRGKVWIDKTRSNYAISRIVPDKSLYNAQNPVTPMKACKNEAEMAGMRLAHIRDGAAMADSIAWITNAIVNEGKSLSEVEVDEVITGNRAKQPEFQEVSFPTIAGVGANGAIIHYRAEEGSDLLKYLTVDEPILIDSGGQYAYGTTDVTRTWHFGEASEEFKENFTRCLKGNIGVDTMIFPENTPGFVLDVFARKSLWEAGKDYGHGTGHGVGAALNVHEGPHSISPRWGNKESLMKGMVVSNEPGFYEDGISGIRIENLLEISYVKDEYNEAYDKGLKEGDEGYPALEPGQKKFLRMKKLTMIPIQKNLIDLSLMTKEELDWLDAYHADVYSKVAPIMDENSDGFKWLTKACEKIDRT